MRGQRKVSRARLTPCQIIDTLVSFRQAGERGYAASGKYLHGGRRDGGALFLLSARSRQIVRLGGDEPRANRGRPAGGLPTFSLHIPAGAYGRRERRRSQVARAPGSEPVSMGPGTARNVPRRDGP